MFCNVCGSEVNQDERFCPVCGAEMSAQIPSVQGIPVEEMKTTPIPGNQMIPEAETKTVQIPVNQGIPMEEMRTSPIPQDLESEGTNQGRNIEQQASPVEQKPSPVEECVVPPLIMPLMTMPQPKAETQQPQAGYEHYSQSGQQDSVPTSEIPTSRVTVSGETENLAGEKADKKSGKDKYRVKARPKKLGLKIALLAILVMGVGVGVFFGIRLLKGKTKNSAYFKTFTKGQVEKTSDNAEYVCGQILLKAKPDVPASRIQSLAEEKHGTIVGEIPVTNDYQIEFENPMMVKEQDLKAIIEEWKQKDKIVASAKLHYAYETEGGFKYTDNPWKDDSKADDPGEKGKEWDETHPSGNTRAAESVWANLVWDSLDKTEYQQVEVGIIDTVFDTTHVDLSDRFAPLKNDADGEGKDTDSIKVLVEGNPVDANGNPTVKEEYAKYIGTYNANKVNPDEKRLMHGTHVAGVIAANMDDEAGITGIAQNAKLHGYAISGNYDADGEITYSSTFEWKYSLSKMMENNIRLINVSMQLNAADQAGVSMTSVNADMDEFLQACITQGYDFLIVKSAGDDKLQDLGDTFLSGISTPAVRDRILVVGGAKSKISSSGEVSYVQTKNTNYGERIDIYAPGAYILSDIPGDRTEMRNGTSGAAAFVSGGCALVMGILPDATMAEVKEIVLNNCYYTVKVTVQENGQQREVERGYLNVYLATETAKARRDAGDSGEGKTSGAVTVDGKPIREWMKARIEEKNKEALEKAEQEKKKKEGTLVISLSADTLERVGDVSKIQCIASKDDAEEIISFDASGTARKSLEKGEWTATIACEGYKSLTLSFKVKSGKETVHEEIVLVDEFNWRQAYWEYIVNNNMLRLKYIDRYGDWYIPKGVLVKDCDLDGIPEIYIKSLNARLATDLYAYNLNVLSIENDSVVNKVKTGELYDESSKGIKLDDEDVLYDEFWRDIDGVREKMDGKVTNQIDQVKTYIFSEVFEQSEKEEVRYLGLDGKYSVSSNNAEIVTADIEYFDNAVYINLLDNNEDSRGAGVGKIDKKDHAVIDQCVISEYILTAEMNFSGEQIVLRKIRIVNGWEIEEDQVPIVIEELSLKKTN